MTRVKLKLCGNRSLLDLERTTKSKADYIGVVFAKSKRQVNVNSLKQWLTECPLQPKQQLVGIFVNAASDEIFEIAQHIPLDIIQAHGTETVDDILQIKELTMLPVWKAIHHEEKAIERMKMYNGIVDGYVIDVKVKGQWGGTGASFNWEHVPLYLHEAKKQGAPCFIAGGITPDNVRDLLQYRPDGIDISSGIETDDVKDADKIKILEERLNI